jgi:hypothetical protein
MQHRVAILVRELAHYLSLPPDLGDVAIIASNIAASGRTHVEFTAGPERGYPRAGERPRRPDERIPIALARNAGGLRRDSLARGPAVTSIPSPTLTARSRGARVSTLEAVGAV